MAEIKEAAVIAAKWWTDKINKVNLNNFNNGDRTSDVSFMMMLVGAMNAMDNNPTPDQLEKFNEILSQKISDELDSDEELFIDTDYGPCEILGKAAKEAKIKRSVFPFKRMMWVSNTEVTVRDGLDSAESVLYKKIK